MKSNSTPTPSVRRTKRAEIYRKAAKLMEDRAIYYDSEVRYACHAMELAERGSPTWTDSKYCAPMRAVFDPDSEEGSAWLCAPELPSEGRRDVRIVALCFMAAMVEAGDA